MRRNTMIASMCFIFFILSFNSYAITQQEWVDAHNKYRSMHINTSPVEWDPDLARGAQECVNRVKGTDWSHSKTWPHENGAFGDLVDAEEVVDLWHSEEEYYDYNTGTYKITAPADETIGHFVQVVGTNVKKIGCACDPSARVKVGDVWFTGVYVCQYDESGYTHVTPRKIGDDILWYHVSGVPAVWLMNGVELKSVAWPGWAPTEWKIVGAGDFDNDGKTDILWRNTKTGENSVWFMDGSTYKTQKALKFEPDLSLKIVGVGDFNGDNRTDILWRHATTKQTLIWLMDGVRHTRSVYLPSCTDTNWKIVGTGDFDGDYHSDILWRNTASGLTAVWYINDAKYKGMSYMPGVHLDWEIGATGDLNEDGKRDILWRNTVSGLNAVWYMDRTAVKSVAFLPTVPAGIGYKMVGAGNFE